MNNDPLAREMAALAQIETVQKILEVVCRTTGLGFSAVARVTQERWIACAVRDEISFGLKPGGELAINTTLCSEIRDHGQVITINNAAEDPKYCDHPTPAQYGLQSYISVPIKLADGQFFGTLCAIDPRPNVVDRLETVEMFKLFAELIAQHIDSQRRLKASEAALEVERKTAQFREQFMAVLGHDLRNPLAAIQSSADLLGMMDLDADVGQIVKIMQRSSARMTELIGNVLDFARGRLGGGLPMDLRHDADLAATLRQVTRELQAAWPHRPIVCDIKFDRPIACDPQRVGQMVSNLVANALAHGDPARPVEVRAHTDDAGLEVCVCNAGRPIPPATLARLFEPFVRGDARGGQQGLGLGLYIASEIARGHRGTLGATSTEAETCFTFRMPTARAK